MMISTKGRYALRVMVDLAEHPNDGYIPLKEIAERQGISEKYLENILKILVQNKLLEGLRGKGGGYKLTMPPKDYRIGQILRLTEGSLSPVSCLEAETCTSVDLCRLMPMWLKLDNMLNDFFDNISLADLIPSEEDKRLAAEKFLHQKCTCKEGKTD